MKENAHSTLVKTIIELQKLQIDLLVGSEEAILMNEAEHKLHKVIAMLEEGE